MIIRYSHNDAPVPKGWRYEPLKYHYDPAAGYGLLIKDDDTISPQILTAVYDYGLLVTIDGVCYRKDMTARQKLELATDLIESAKNG